MYISWHYIYIMYSYLYVCSAMEHKYLFEKNLKNYWEGNKLLLDKNKVVIQLKRTKLRSLTILQKKVKMFNPVIWRQNIKNANYLKLQISQYLIKCVIITILYHCNSKYISSLLRLFFISAWWFTMVDQKHLLSARSILLKEGVPDY